MVIVMAEAVARVGPGLEMMQPGGGGGEAKKWRKVDFSSSDDKSYNVYLLPVLFCIFLFNY